MTNRNKGLALVFGTALISGVSIFVNGLSVKMIDPSVFSFLKNGIVALGLIGLLLAAREFKNLRTLNLKQWGQLALIGLVGGCIPFLMFFNGLALAGSSAGSLIHKSMFLFVAVGAVFFLKERLNAKILLAATLLMFGNILLIQGDLSNPGIGHALVFGATLFWTAENLLSKHLLKETTSNVVAAGRMIFGSAFMAIYLGITGQIGIIGSMSSEQWLWTFIPTLLLFGFVVTWYNGLKKIPAGLATAILLIGAPITSLLNYGLLGKTLTPSQLLGISLLLAGTASWIIWQKSGKAKTTSA